MKYELSEDICRFCKEEINCTDEVSYITNNVHVIAKHYEFGVSGKLFNTVETMKNKNSSCYYFHSSCFKLITEEYS